MQCHTVNTAIM